MNKDYVWKSTLGPQMREFLQYKHIAGLKFEVPERWLKQFDQYCHERGAPAGSLSRECIEDFCYHEGIEAKATLECRLRLLRDFGMFLKKAGMDAYIVPDPPRTFRYPKHEPYIFTEQEIAAIFRSIDNWRQPYQSHSNRSLVDPVLFRMLYGCGLRIMEALRLKIADVDLDENVLRICQGKNKKDRFVPIAESLAQRCRKFKSTIHFVSSPDDYFFPGFHGNCYSNSTIYVRFRQYLWDARISHSGHGPRLHDFRHVYCVHRLKKWVLSGEDLTNMLPYLAAYLGHADFRGTEYYLKMTADMYPEIICRLEKSHGYIIPETGGDAR